MRRSRRVVAVAIGMWAALGAVPTSPLAAGGSPTYRLLKQDVIINADVWAERPRMLAAGLGFTGIIGVPGLTTDDLARSEQLVRAAGGAWNTITCASGESPTLAAYTSASTPQQVANAYGRPTTRSDGLPVEFSWPIRPSTLDPTDFRITFTPAAAWSPSWPRSSPTRSTTSVRWRSCSERSAIGCRRARRAPSTRCSPGWSATGRRCSSSGRAAAS